MKFGRSAAGAKVTVIGGGPSALSCAYYLTLAGCKVNVFAQENQPGGELWKRSDTNPLLKTAVLHDVEGVMSSGISFQGDLQLWKNLDFKNILENNSAVYLAEAKVMALFLRAPSYHHRNRLRSDLTKKIFMLEGLNTDFIDACGDTPLAHQWTALHLGDYTAYYLAMAYGVDPTPVAAIEGLKKEMAGS